MKPLSLPSFLMSAWVQYWSELSVRHQDEGSIMAARRRRLQRNAEEGDSTEIEESDQESDIFQGDEDDDLEGYCAAGSPLGCSTHHDPPNGEVIGEGQYPEHTKECLMDPQVQTTWL